MDAFSANIIDDVSKGKKESKINRRGSRLYGKVEIPEVLLLITYLISYLEPKIVSSWSLNSSRSFIFKIPEIGIYLP